MMHLKNISIGNAKTAEQYQLTRRVGVIWLYSEEGKNWYEEQKNFSPDTLKIAYDTKGIIVCIDKDVSAINPTGLSVVELPNITANRRADASGHWMYQDGQVIKRIYTREELVSQAEAEKVRLLAEATTPMAPLQDAVDIDRATEAETALLLEWKKYRVALNRIDTSKAPVIDWPIPPNITP